MNTVERNVTHAANPVSRAEISQRPSRSQSTELPLPQRPAIRVSSTVITRLPFTTSVTLLTITLAVVSGGLWSAVQDREWFRNIAFGYSTMQDGKWWTPVLGSFFALTPILYVPVLASFALLVGLAEWHLGTARAAAVWAIGHMAGVLGAVGFLVMFRDTGWAWVEHLAGQADVGMSAGALAAAAATSVVLEPPWRLRLQLGLLTYVLVSVVFIGTLADLEHALPVLTMLMLAGRWHRWQNPQSAHHRPSRRELRLFAATGLLIIVLAEVVLWLVPAEGPLGSTSSTEASGLGVLVDVVVVAIVINGLRHGRRWAWWVITALGAVNVVAGVWVLLDPDPAELDTLALSVAGSMLWTAELIMLLKSANSFRAPTGRKFRRRQPISTPDRVKAHELLKRYGGGTISHMSTWPDNRYFVSEDGQSFIAYQRHAGVAIALGDPVGPENNRDRTLSGFAAMSEASGMIPALFSVGTGTADHLTDALGWHRLQVAEDNIIDLRSVEFKGRKWQDIRSAFNRAMKENITYREVTLAHEDEHIRAQVLALSREWMADKGLPEMGFTLGGFDEAMDPDVRVGLAMDSENNVHGVVSWLPVWGDDGRARGWTLDMMRRRKDGFKPVVEFLIAASIRSFQQTDAEFVSLSGAPLARSADAERPAGWDRILNLLGSTMEPVYGFRSLHAFKAKFHPRHQPMHLVFRDGGDLPRIGIALAKAYLPNIEARDLVHLATAGHGYGSNGSGSNGSGSN